MALSPYPRRLARVAMPNVLRWEDMPAGAVRKPTLDTTAWADQVASDAPSGVTVAVTPADGGLTAASAAVDANVITLTLTAASGGIGTDYLVLLTATTPGGRVEKYPVRVLVTDPAF